MKLPMNLLSQTYTKPNVFLCETDKKKICGLETIDMNASLKFNSYSELNFTVPRVYTNMITGETSVNPHYDKIEALRLIYLEGFGYFEIQDPEIVSDGIREVKNVTAYSLEYTLSQKYLEGLKINTGEVDSLEVIEAESNNTYVIPITLYDEANENLSLLNIILEKIYGWSIGSIDNSLMVMGRTFEISRVSVYDFIMQEICDKFNCFAVFDTINNKINLYAESLITKHIGDGISTAFTISPAYDTLGTVSIDSYKTTAYTYEIKIINNVETGILTFDEPPSNGARIEITDGSQNKWATDVYISFDNLAQEVNVSYSADDIKTVLTVKGADDLDIREVNMGLPYIVDLSYYYTVEWMGQDLYDAYTLYLQNCDNGQTQYQQNSQRMLELDGLIQYEENRLSLQYSIADNVTVSTVGTYYVRCEKTSEDETSNYYYLEVTLPDDWNADTTYYTLSGNDLDETKFSNFYEALQTYFSSQSNKDTSEISELEDSFAFMEEYTIDDLVAALKSATTTSTKESAILLFLDELWNQIGLTPLKTLYYDTYTKLKETNEEAGWSDPSNSNYWNYYPVNIVLRSLDLEIAERESTIQEYQDEYDALAQSNVDISNDALIYNYFTYDQLVRLNPFLREDEYTDDNFVETSIDTIETLMQTKKELLECGRIELAKLCEPKLAFSMDMANIYALPEFEPIVDKFQLGNLINVVMRSDYIKRARLLEVDINFDDFSDFTCEFGELTNLKTQSSIHADLLASAITAGKSVASNASYWNQSSDSATSLGLQIHQGLLDATTVIKAIDGEQGVSIDKYGIHLRKYDETTGALDPVEGWIVNNQILYSENNFDSNTPVKAVFGEYTVGGQTKWGVLAEAVMAGYIAGSTIEGCNINIGEGTFTVTEDGNMTATSGKIAGWTIHSEYLSKELAVNDTDYWMYLQAPNGSTSVNAFAVRTKASDDTEWDTQFAVNYKGKLTAKNADITGAITANSLTLGSDVTIPYSKLSNTPDLDIYIAKDGTVGKTPAEGSTGFKVSSSGLLQASNAVIYGTIYASAGEIGGWTVYSELLRKEITIDDVTYQMYLQPADGVNTTNAFAVRKKSTDDTSWDTQFSVNYAGKMTAKNANITGTITAEDGSIAGYNIGSGGSYSNALYKRVSGDSADYEVGIKATSGETDLAFYVKKSADSWGSSSNVFYVNNSGKLYAKNANISGEINASTGTIGSWTIGDMEDYTDSIYSTYCAATTPSSSNPEYATFMRGKGAENTLAIGVKKRTSSSTAWTDADTPFYVRKDGYVKMSNANVTGTINAESGNIGGWGITATRLYSSSSASNTEANALHRMVIGSYDYDETNRNAIIVQSRSSTSDSWTSNFRVRYDGSVYMNNATITGESTIASACIPDLSASKITSGTISTDRLSTSVITTSNFSSKTLSTNNLSIRNGCVIGVSGENGCATIQAYNGLTGLMVQESSSSSYGANLLNIVKCTQEWAAGSNREIKSEIHDFDDRYDAFYDKLNPQLFKYNDMLEKGYVMGYIWQEVDDAINEVGLTRNDVGAVYEDQYINGGLGLRRVDFVALNTWQIQKLKNRVTELENKFAAIEAQLTT